MTDPQFKTTRLLLAVIAVGLFGVTATNLVDVVPSARAATGQWECRDTSRMAEPGHKWNKVLAAPLAAALDEFAPSTAAGTLLPFAVGGDQWFVCVRR